MEWFGTLHLALYQGPNVTHASAYKTMQAESREEVFHAIRNVIIAEYGQRMSKAVIESFNAEPNRPDIGGARDV